MLQHMRLLSTRPDLLPAWRDSFPKCEGFTYEQSPDPLASAYRSLIEKTINEEKVSYAELVETCQAGVIAAANISWAGSDAGHLKYRRWQYSVTLIAALQSLD